MRNLLPLLILFVLVTSCSDDESIDAQQILLAKISSVHVSQSIRNNSIILDYDSHRRLTDVTIDGAGGIVLNQKFNHQYDSKSKIIEFSHSMGATLFRTEKFTYEKSGRLASALTSFPNSISLSGHNFTYNTAGQISQIEEFNDLNPSNTLQTISLDLLTYDNVGNVIKIEGYTTTPSGVVLEKKYVLDVKYDDKINPLQGMGSPLINGYSLPITYFGSSAYYSFISYFSLNNAVELVQTDLKNGVPVVTTLTAEYIYNDLNYPIEIMVNDEVKRLEYKVL